MISGSAIPNQQNETELLRLLAGASEAYARGKSILTVQMVLAIPTAALASLLLTWNPALKIWTTLFFTSAGLIDVLYLNPLQNRLKRKGAVFQEMFDCRLFRLGWARLRCGEEIDHEEIKHFSERLIQKEKWLNRCKDWYPKAVSELPLQFARLICQRSSLRWDRELRHRYQATLLSLLFILIGGVVSAAVWRKDSVEEMILSVYVPLAPAVLWTIRETIAQKEAANRIEKLFAFAKALWRDSLSSAKEGEQMDRAVRELQDAIFDHRARSPLIFNWAYRLLRVRLEREMQFSAEQLVCEWKQTIGKG